MRLPLALAAAAWCLAAPPAAANQAPPATPPPSPPAAATTPSASLEALTFLLGDWDATGGGQPGQGQGRTTFARGLQDRVITRTNVAEYPATDKKPASRHDDLMVIYVARGGLRADYYDSEGHVIRYGVTAPAAGVAVFLSDEAAGEPRFRLTYKLDPGGTLNGEFAIAPPNQPDLFKPYLTWQSRKAATAAG